MESILTCDPKPKTSTIWIGWTDKQEYISCKKCGHFHLRKEKCSLCEQIEKQINEIKRLKNQEKIRIRKEKLEKKKQEKEKKKQFSIAKKNVRFCILWGRYQKLIEDIKGLINIGIPSEVIMAAAFFDERNPPYDLSNAKPDYRIKIKPFGTVLEHINGRETIGYYCIYAILIGDINNAQELEQFYLTYCGQIKTDADFNNKVIKPYQNEEGAISAEMYIELLKKERNYTLTDDEKEYFRSKFLYTKYGTIKKDDVINLIKNGCHQNLKPNFTFNSMLKNLKSKFQSLVLN